MAYQPRSQLKNGNMDPLADPAACARDASLMKKLGMNVIRVYQVRIGNTKFLQKLNVLN